MVLLMRTLNANSLTVRITSDDLQSETRGFQPGFWDNPDDVSEQIGVKDGRVTDGSVENSVCVLL